MTKQRAMRLAEKWANGLVCSVRDGEAEEYHRMFLDMLLAKYCEEAGHRWLQQPAEED